MWYTALGHTPASYSEGNFRQHVLGGLETVTGAEASDCGEPRQATPTANDFEMVTIDDDTESPMELTVADDGRVFYVERITGEINVYNPANGQVTTAATIPVSSVQENGLMGIQLAPDFNTTNQLYVTYTPITPNNHVARVALHGRGEQHDRPELGADHLPVGGAAQRVLPLRRLARLRPQRRPLHLHRRQHQPVRLGRLHADRRAARPRVLGCAAHVGQLEQPQRQGPAHPSAPGRDRRAGGRHDLLDPERQHVRPGHAADAARDLRDGLPQPVPDHHRSAHGLGARRQLRT